MVFESLVADLLNKYLGDYVENLDRSQLKIGIWGGDVVLHDLSLKQSALDELNLPIKTIYGYLGKLVLKIPWKNLYNAPVEAQIDKLFILATPNTMIKYNAEKEENWIQEEKQNELRKIELAKKAELEKGKTKPADNSFTEKLVTQIVRNVQISIKNIHIRYEDGINRPGSPIAVGVTLHSLSVKSINSWGDPTPIDPINLIFKELVLQCLSVYWNPNAKLFTTSNSSENDYKIYFEQGIATKDVSPTDYKYILGPINSSANLRINSKPESDGTDFTVPQVLLKFEMERLLIRFAKVQFQDILVLLDSFHRMSIQTLYRKYRPYLNSYRGHYREWWKFAYECIVETEIRRRKRNWDWNHILQHRDLCRNYASAYKAKISATKPSSDVLKNCQNMEKKLDVLNIILIKERIELEVEREGKAQEAIREAQGGWLSRWWNGGAKPESSQQEDDIVRQFQDAMTGSEKEKLFKAIGYQESASPTEYPPYFVVVDLSVVLHKLQLEIVNQDLIDPHVLSVRFSQVACRLEKRPQSLSVNTYVKVLSARGSRQGEVVPRLVEPKVMTKKDHDELDSSDSQLCLFKCLVEMSPLDGMCDQRIHVTARPLKIIYDAVTINNIVDVFTLEEKAAIQPIQAAAQNKLAELKQKSALGLQHVIDKHTVMDLQVDIMASYIIIPHNGFYQKNAPAVVMNLGQLELHSQPRPKLQDNTANVRALYTQGHSEEEILAEMISKSYDNFVLQLSDLQVLFSMEDECWDFENCSPAAEKLYLLKPTSLTINLAMCFIADDPRLPKMKLDARLPLISFHFVENRIINLVKLLLSIPLPEESSSPSEIPQSEMKGAAAMGSTASLSGLGGGPLKLASSFRMDTSQADEQVVQMTDIVMNFELKEVTVCIMKGSWDTPDESQKLICFKLVSLEAAMEKKTFELSVSLRLGGASLVQTYADNPVHILKTPMTSGQQEYLLSIKYVNIDRSSPEFHSKYGSVLQLIDFDFTKVELLFHQEAILYLMNFTNNIQTEIKQIQDSIEVDEKHRIEYVVGQVAAPIVSSPSMVQSSATYTRVLSMIKEEGGLIASKPMTKARSRQLKRVEVIDLKITVCMRSISVGLATHKLGPIIYLGVTGGIAVVTMKKSYTQVEASLMGVSVKDNLLRDTRYSQILSVVDDKEALVTKIVLFNDDDDKASRKMDVQVKASMACVRFIFLNRFISSLMNFLNNFQAAQDVIVEASHAAAEAAKHNVQDVYTNAIRVVLDIKIKAPIILIPVNTVDPDAFLLDLGFLSLSNNIVDVLTTESEESAALDNLQLDLQNLKLSRVVVNNDLKIMSERLVLKPISFKLSVQRNLSSGWYTAIPDLEIGGKLHCIHLIIFNEDYSLLMRVLKENLGDVADTDTKSSIASTSGPKPSRTLGERSLSLQPSNVTLPRKSSATPDSVVPPKIITSEKVNVSIKFYFTMETLMVELFSGDANDKDTVEGLAEFKLLMICVRGSLLSDNSIQLSLLLMDCILDDTRPSQSANIKRYMEKKVTEQSGDDGTSSAKTMIDIVFQQKGEAMFVDFRVSSFVLILNLEHLLKIVSVFDVENNSSNQPSVTQPQPRAKTATVSNIPEKEGQPKFILTLNLKLEHPDIILVEKMDDINTSALMFQAEIILKLRMLEDSQFINGSITDMQLFSCCYNPIFRKDTKSHVLRPFSILMSGCSPQNVGLNIDISTTNIRISVSADTLQLLNNILSTVSQSNKVVSSKSIQFIDNSDMWKISPFSEDDYAFLTTEVAQEVTVELPEFSVVGDKTEVCIFSIPSLVVTVETGTGLSRIPMLLLETSVQATIKDWSSQLNVDSHLGVKLSYYNHSLALWEPLIEPVEEIVSGQSKFYPWELNLQVETNKPNNQSDVFHGKVKPEMAIYISSKEMMSITITKSCLEVLNNLSASFTDAIYKPTDKLTLDQAQFVLINNTGLNIRVFLKDSDFALYQHTRPGLNVPDDIKEVQLDSGAQVELSPLDKDFIPLESSTAKDRFISIKVMDYDCEMEVPVMRADKRFFLLNQRSASNDQWGIVSDVTVNNGVTCITLRSIIQVINHFRVPIKVYYMTAKGNEVKLVGNIEPRSTLDLPLKAIYTPTSELFFSVLGYTVSIMPFVWKDLQRSLEKTLLMQCNPKNREDKEPFYIKAVGEIEQVYFELTNRHTMASNCYNIHMRPAVVLKNLLPVNILVCAQGVPSDRQVRAGESLQLPTIEPGLSSVVIRIPDYLDREWACKHEISSSPAEFCVWTFDSYVSSSKFSLDLGVHCVDKHGSLIFSLYCPFWMINNTGLLLAYRQSDDMSNVIFHPKDLQGPVMFSFHSKTFFAKKKSCVRVGDGSWSDKFSLDVAGSSGVVVSKSKDIQYQIGVHIRLTYNTLTKQIRFTPYYIIVNNFDLPVELKENADNSSWILVEHQSCSPLWPAGSKEEGCLILRIKNTTETTIPFLFCKPHTSVLKLDNQYGAVYVDVQITEGMAYITVYPYENGMAPALILNHTNTTIDFRDKSKLDSGFMLRPMEKKLFSWETSDSNRQLVFGEGKGSHTLREDGIGEIILSGDESNKAYWVSFLYGLQRVLLLTRDSVVAQQANNISDIDAISQEIEISIHGIGVSLVNNLSKVEVLYLGITSSGVIWEVKKTNKTRFKQLSSNDSGKIEAAYGRYTAQLEACENPSPSVHVDQRIHVNFETGEMLSPVRKVIRRRYNTGLWVMIKSSPSQLQFHAKVNRVQIDNQMSDCVFPVIFFPVPPPKSINMDNIGKPFVELSIMKRLNNYSAVQQYKYFKLLIQEFHVKVDICFINALVKLFEEGEKSEHDKVTNFVKDLKLTTDPLMSQIVSTFQDQKNVYDILHLSPLKIHVSFSLSGGGQGSDQGSSVPEFITVFAQSFGVTLTDIQDVVFKLAYFERQHSLMTQGQLISEVQQHYISQLLKQIYVLVLGLDVIGNPFGLVMGFTQGATDLFYEPFQGAIQGPGEFAEGLVLGVRSLFGHTVGGAAGAFSKITGAMGKGLAALTFDKEYQRQRREAMSNKPQNVQEGLAQSGKGLVMGVFEGVGGVITKPISGAKEEGVQGFFKGVGKGIMGLVTRPTAGVIDFASGSFSAVKRVTDTTEEVTRMRVARHFDTDGLVKPYSKLLAEGNKLLMDLDKGKYLATDVYVFHMPIGQGKQKDMLLITDQRVAYLSHNEIFGGFQMEWFHVWSEMLEEPKVVPQGVALSIADKKKGIRILAGASTGKVLLIQDEKIKRFLVDKMIYLMNRATLPKRASLPKSNN